MSKRVQELPTVTLPPRVRDKVAIIGFTPHGLKAPFQDESWDFWGLNDLHAMFEANAPGIFQSNRVEWFQIHRAENGEYPGARDPEHTAWLKAQTIPIWMWEHHDDIPASLAYPLKDVLTAPLLPNGQPMSPEAYYNNTISWMIALAIFRGYTTIGVWGVDMALDGVHGQSEYTWQRPSVEYFLGVARGLGIEILIPQESELLKTSHLYGYDNMTATRRKWLDRLEQLEISDQQTSSEYEAVKRALHETRGAIWAVQQLLESKIQDPALQPAAEQLLNSLKPKHQELKEREITIVNEYEGLKRSLHELRGAKNTVIWAIRNYIHGEGAFQDLPRMENSLVKDEIVDLTAYETLPASDGQKPTNRIVQILKSNKGSGTPMTLTGP